MVCTVTTLGTKTYKVTNTKYRKYFTTKYRLAGILLKVNSVTYFTFKLQLTSRLIKITLLFCKLSYRFTLKKYINLKLRFKKNKT